jgi:DNA/RNA-binding domain of Phe-tRNA-synthetase-like protein
VLLFDQIAPAIFELSPGYCWGKVLSWNLDLSGSCTGVELLLREAEAETRQSPALADVAQHPRIAAWRDAFSSFGARPSKFQSSVEALIRRARRGDELPTINQVVGVYNALSLRHLLPIGGDDLDLVRGETQLRRAAGDEIYHELGTGAAAPPAAGEVIYVDDDKVLCRRWCWRQGSDSGITAASRRVVLNVHGLPPASRLDVERACQELATLLGQICGGSSSWYVLDASNPCRESRVG